MTKIIVLDADGVLLDYNLAYGKAWGRVQDACKGPCLTWNQRDGWNVTTAEAPGNMACKRLTLLGSFKDRPKFWLFQAADGGYIARLETVALHVAEQSPREAISLLRTAYALYERTYPSEGRRTAEKQPIPSA